MTGGKRLCCGLMLVICFLISAACHQSTSKTEAVRTRPLPPNSSPALKQVVDAALEQTKYTLYYDQSYTKIAYPGGDVPLERGACTDVIVPLSVRAALTCRKRFTRIWNATSLHTLRSGV